MHTNTADTAILLFAHEAEHEAEAKALVWGAGVRTTKKIASLLLNHTLAVSRKAKLPMVPVYTGQQRGSTFGERLANAFQVAFAAGYQRVICVGSDCPSLTTQSLLQAAQALQQHDMVLGPAADGGAYLIGMHISCFDPEQLSLLNWQSGQVLQELTLYSYRQQGGFHSLVLLHTKSDVDSAEDLQTMLRKLPERSKLRHKVLALLYQQRSRGYADRYLSRKPSHRLLRLSLLRAPPIFRNVLSCHYPQTK